MKNTKPTPLIPVAKTVKLFIGGDFPRTESGRSAPVFVYKTKKVFANACLASRKDFRNAVTAAQAVQSGWQSKTAYNRSQILYRMAEMAEGRREEFYDVFIQTLGLTKVQAKVTMDEAIDALVYYAGWTDKYQQVLGSVNPVSGPHHNFTSSEAVGVVTLVSGSESEKFNFAGFVAQVAAIIVSGNSVVALIPVHAAALLAPFAEVLATSDLSKGVVNLLSGDLNELYKYMGSHMEVQSISIQSSQKKLLGEIKEMAAENMKRVIGPVENNRSLQHIMYYLEFKTVWHPIGS